MISQNRERGDSKSGGKIKLSQRNVLLRRADENEKAVILKMINCLTLSSKNFAANKKEFMCTTTIIIHFKLNSNTDFNLISDPFGARSSVASYSSKVEALDEIFYKS